MNGPGEKDTHDCPECGDEGAYFNGEENECPACGHAEDAIGEDGTNISQEIKDILDNE